MKKTFLLLTAFLAFYACSEQTEIEPQKKKTTQGKNSKINLLEDTSIPETLDLGNYYLHEGDILIPKESENTFLARTATLIPRENGHVKIKFDSSIPPNSPWRSATSVAGNVWSNVYSYGNTPYINITLTEGSDYDILVESDFNVLPNTVIAAAEFPSNCNPGYRIRINLDFYNNYSTSQSTKVYNMVHEIGHTLGLRHTNWRRQGETFAYNMPGSTGSNPDPNSVMNGGTALNEFNGLSSRDKSDFTNLYNSDINKVIYYPNEGDVIYYLTDIYWSVAPFCDSTPKLKIYLDNVLYETVHSAGGGKHNINFDYQTGIARVELYKNTFDSYNLVDTIEFEIDED